MDREATIQSVFVHVLTCASLGDGEGGSGWTGYVYKGAAIARLWMYTSMEKAGGDWMSGRAVHILVRMCGYLQLCVGGAV